MNLLHSMFLVWRYWFGVLGSTEDFCMHSLALGVWMGKKEELISLAIGGETCLSFLSHFDLDLLVVFFLFFPLTLARVVFAHCFLSVY